MAVSEGGGGDGASPERVEPYHTLSNLDPELTPDIATLDRIFFERFEACCAGGVLWGTNSREEGDWGRGIALASTQTIYIRYCPSTLPYTPLRPGEHGRIAVRLVDKLRSEVFSAVVWPMQQQPVKPNGVTPHFQTLCGHSVCRAVGCRLLHVLTIGMFGRHKHATGMRPADEPEEKPPPKAGKNGRAQQQQQRSAAKRRDDPSTSPCWNPDGFNCHCTRATTISVRTVNNKTTYQVMAAPGHSGQVVAAQIAGIGMEDPKEHILLKMGEQPWEKMCANTQRQVLEIATSRNVPMQTLADATAAAQGVLSLVEGDGLLAFLADPFFKGALPDRLVQPNGVPLLLCMATRLAMRPEDYGLPAGTADDQQASARLRVLFESGNEPLSQAVRPPQYAIDLVLRSALRIGACTGNAEQEEVIQAHKTFWHRVGQRLVTVLWGLGALPPGAIAQRPVAEPWRMKDELAAVHDKAMFERRVMPEGREGAANANTVELAYVAEKRMALLRIHAEVAHWLRTGTHNGVRLSESNIMGAERAQTQWHVEQSISDDMIVSWWARNELQYELQHDGKEQRVLRPVERQPPSPPLSNKERRKIFLGTWNDAAIKDSIDTIARALHSGTVVHMDWHMGFYAVGPHEKQGCIHCDAPVHVLGGVMLGTALSRCMICHARRCQECAQAIADKAGHGEPCDLECGRCGAPCTIKYVQRDASGETITHQIIGVRDKRVA